MSLKNNDMKRRSFISNNLGLAAMIPAKYTSIGFASEKPTGYLIRTNNDEAAVAGSSSGERFLNN